MQEKDVIEISDKIQKNPDVMLLSQEKNQFPPYLKKDGKKGTLVRSPQKGDVEVPFNTQQIIEYYSR